MTPEPWYRLFNWPFIWRLIALIVFLVAVSYAIKPWVIW